MSQKHLGKLTVREFFARFPDDEACLNHIMEIRYGQRHECQNCGKYRTFHRVKGRPAFSCAECRAQIHPCAGTIFQDSRTPLQIWFYAIYLFVTTRHGVSGKELERTLGVTYKCAYRIGMKIRELMANANGFKMLKGHIEADECYVGGAAYLGGRQRGAFGRGTKKTVVLGLKERGGRVHAQVVPNAKTDSLRGPILRNVEAGSIVSTDQWNAYSLLTRDGFKHGIVNHSQHEYVNGDIHTNSVESFWRLFKQSVKSTHIHVSRQYMDVYLKEFTFRSNYRAMQNAMFDLLIAAV